MDLCTTGAGEQHEARVGHGGHSRLLLPELKSGAHEEETKVHVEEDCATALRSFPWETTQVK